MKSKIRKAVLTSCAALPLFLFAAGCNDKNTDLRNDSTVASRDTNAAMTNADNSGVNVRDRDTNNLTPGDQGNSESDRTTTQKIRQMLVSGTNNVSGTTNYSVTAQNVKIITANGKVTLRGPVKTDAEKSGIESIAKNVAGEGNVDDQLEVKFNPQTQ